MSYAKNRNFQFWKVFADSLRSSVRLGSYTERDWDSYMESLLISAMALSDSLTDGIDRTSRIQQWAFDMSKVDPYDLGLACKEFLSYFRNYVGKGSFTGFKHQYQARYSFLGAYFAPIKEEVEKFLSQPNPSCFAIINLHLQCLCRLTLLDVDFSEKCLKDYIDCENRLRQFQYNYSRCVELNSILREWLQDFNYDGYLPHHGPGGVACLGRCGLSDKYRSLGTDQRLDYFISRICDDAVFETQQSFQRQCQVVFVPKSMTSWRTISMEPATLQYHQQGVWDCLDKYMCRHRHLSKVVKIHDQSFNKNLAQVASARKDLCTIDLSAASDTVSWELVKRALRGTPLLVACYATRSEVALLPDGSKVKLAKFAPMGSALCFPIECLIFAGICELAVRTLGARPICDTLYSVYGDDIIVTKDIVSEVLFLLEEFGFLVNHSKTFIHQNVPFRESCGGEYYDGVDVSPFRLSRKFSAESISRRNPGMFGLCIDSANNAYRHNLPTVRRWFIHRLLQLPQRLQPRFSQDEERGLYSPEPTNFHLARKYSPAWQGETIYCGEITTVRSPAVADELEETIRYHEWFVQSASRSRGPIWPGECVAPCITRQRGHLSSRRLSMT